MRLFYIYVLLIPGILFSVRCFSQLYVHQAHLSLHPGSDIGLFGPGISGTGTLQGTGVIHMYGSDIQYIDMPNQHIPHLSIHAPVELKNNLYIDQILSFTNSHLFTNQHTIALSPQASLKGAHAHAYVVTQSTGGLSLPIPQGEQRLFPVGPSPTQYAPLRVSNPGRSGAVLVNSRPAEPGSHAWLLPQHWTLQRPDGSSGPLQVSPLRSSESSSPGLFLTQHANPQQRHSDSWKTGPALTSDNPSRYLQATLSNYPVTFGWATSVMETKPFAFHPNPTRGPATGVLDCASAQTILLQVTDNKGKIVLHNSVKVSTGSQLLRMDLHTLPPGAYHWSLSGEGTLRSGTIVKL